jgi:hypothetical protein
LKNIARQIKEQGGVVLKPYEIAVTYLAKVMVLTLVFTMMVTIEEYFLHKFVYSIIFYFINNKGLTQVLSAQLKQVFFNFSVI